MYSNGVPTQLDFNRAYHIDRSVYWDGALQTESNGRGHDTRYDYDAAGRLEKVTPPGNDASTYTYDPTGAGYSVTRGTGPTAFTETTTWDGLGRVIETRNSLGVRRTWEYDGMGRLVFASYPFTTGAPEVGDKFEYDGLGRPTTTSRRFVATGHRPLAGACADVNSCKVTVAYLADHCRSTTVDRALGDKVTTRACFNSFADPSEERLRLLTDAAGKALDLFLRRGRQLGDVQGAERRRGRPLVHLQAGHLLQGVRDVRAAGDYAGDGPRRPGTSPDPGGRPRGGPPRSSTTASWPGPPTSATGRAPSTTSPAPTTMTS